MAETTNIAKMAEKLSTELFPEFLWKQPGPMNINWKCETPESHGAQTHPSDIVFSYDEPYSNHRTFINCDLKSYKTASITNTSIRKALENLSKALSCAQQSQEWQQYYVDQHVSPRVMGLLFVYNHDGEYDKEFTNHFQKTHHLGLQIPKGSRIFVFGPKDIFWLNNVTCEINSMRGRKLLPDRDLCSFIHPHLVLRKNVQPSKATAATLEMLSSSWIPLGYKQGDQLKGIVIFYRKPGNTVDEFLYLIDYLLHYNIFTNNIEIKVKVLEGDRLASSNFSKAVDQYIEFCDGGTEIRDLLNSITFESIQQVHRSFCDIEIGMDYA